MLTIYSEHITARLAYVIEVIFEDILGVDVLVTEDQETFKMSSAGLNYSNIPIPDKPYIKPHGLLFEQGIRTQEIRWNLDETASFFPTESDLVNHDVFAASFYLLSRYEEYLPHEKDAIGRFQGRLSASGKQGLLHKPLVDEWVLELYRSLTRIHPFLPTVERKFRQLDTFDIDVAYAYKGRGLFRRMGSVLKDLMRMDFRRIKERRAVLSGRMEDPFSSYAMQLACNKKDNLRHFFLLGDRSELDRNIDHRSEELQELVSILHEQSNVGLHPSIAANSSFKTLKKECLRLEEMTGEPVGRSRQHFLYLDLPNTYRNLVALGIKEDYSMGFADRVGFRAGTCSPFPWFDLEADERTELYIIPLAVMDSSLKDYMGLDVEAAMKEIQKVRQQVQSVQGLYVQLWHNHTISDYGEWAGWKQVFSSSLSEGFHSKPSEATKDLKG